MDEISELLAEYVRKGSEAAFAELVRRHVGLIYSAALRQLGNSHDAEDVTQIVFLALAQNASKIRKRTVLGSWLLSATRYVCATRQKLEGRRKHHERQSSELAAAQDRGADSTSWEQVAPVLDEAVADLPESHRGAFVLRYFLGMSMREVAASLGISEMAARQRVSRAVADLRELFAQRGINSAPDMLPTLIGAHALQPIPAGLSTSVSAAAHAIGSAGAHVAAASIRNVFSAKAAWGMAACLFVAAVAGGVVAAKRHAASYVSSTTVTRPPVNPAMASGWPVALPGQITGTPAVADLEGNGKLTVIVPCFYTGGKVVNPQPIQQRLVYALRADGTIMPGWPVNISAIPGANPVSRGLGWASNPSVMDVDGDGHDEVFILDRDGVDYIKDTPRGPTARKIAPWGDGFGSVPLVDIDGDGQVDMILGRVLTHVDGSPLPTWPRQRTLYGGFAPCIGDARGDGQMLLYHPFYDDSATVAGYDHFGRLLAGWPHKVTGQCFAAPVMGDITGDGTMSVVAIDSGGHLFAWGWDGKPLPATHSEGRLQGILKEPIDASMSPALADLDHEGHAQIIVFDNITKSLKAWRADGSGVTSPDGTIVRLQGPRCWGGVSVVGPDEQGEMDLFVASYWVRLDRNKRTTVLNMLPQDAEMSTQPTVADLDGNGTMDVIFGLSDGRVFVYRTGKPFQRPAAQWPTANGNFRRTGAWTPSSKLRTGLHPSRRF